MDDLHSDDRFGHARIGLPDCSSQRSQRSWTVDDDCIAICTRCGSLSRDHLEALHQLIAMYLQSWPQDIQKNGLESEWLIPGI